MEERILKNGKEEEYAIRGDDGWMVTREACRIFAGCFKMTERIRACIVTRWCLCQILALFFPRR